MDGYPAPPPLRKQEQTRVPDPREWRILLRPLFFAFLVQRKRSIDNAFGGAASVEEIVRRLEERAANGSGDGSEQEWARATLDNLSKASPTALKVWYCSSVRFWSLEILGRGEG